MIRTLCLAFLATTICFSSTFGKEAARQNETSTAQGVDSNFERVGGTYLVTSIKRLSEGGFRVVFEAKTGEPRFKTLVLESPHVHVSVAEGSELRLSADVLKTKGDTAEVSQMVLFVPGRVGSTPVWMLSKNGEVSSSPPARLLEMHVPTTDYQIL